MKRNYKVAKQTRFKLSTAAVSAVVDPSLRPLSVVLVIMYCCFVFLILVLMDDIESVADSTTQQQ